MVDLMDVQPVVVLVAWLVVLLVDLMDALQADWKVVV